MTETPNLGLQIPEETDVYDIGYVKNNMETLDAISDEKIMEEAFASVFTHVSESEAETALSDTGVEEE